ncbi:MAG: acetylxylan esterase [Propionibacteriaceae bacterium]|jgi:cephalosporin-C deacetylase|nr:acetylxylan esterase [Propionibacteriaceae bacterium]
MPRFDFAPDELRAYRPEVAEPADFDAFWAATLAEHTVPDAEPVLTPVDAGLRLVDVWDVSFAGYDGHPIKAWLLLPSGATGPLPAVVRYAGYNGGRHLPHEHLVWPTAGYAEFVMDTRGQGSWGSGGDTPDPSGSSAHAPGYMTDGILDPEQYYYRRVFTDAVCAFRTVRNLPQVDTARIIATGVSQGGGITIAVAALADGVAAAMPDVPFLCHFERAVGLTDADPYSEITRYLAVRRNEVETAFRTLSYFDGANFAKRAASPALFSVGLLDDICPPSTVYAARNRWAGPADIVEYAFNTHDGGGAYQWQRQVRWLQGHGLAP